MNADQQMIAVAVCLYSTGHWIGGTVMLGLSFVRHLNRNFGWWL